MVTDKITDFSFDFLGILGLLGLLRCGPSAAPSAFLWFLLLFLTQLEVVKRVCIFF
jgi:hypothetical protein